VTALANTPTAGTQDDAAPEYDDDTPLSGDNHNPMLNRRGCTTSWASSTALSDARLRTAAVCPVVPFFCSEPGIRSGEEDRGLYISLTLAKSSRSTRTDSEMP
jgi:hypothetical protein